MGNFLMERGPIARLTITRKAVANSLDQQAWRELYEVLVDLSLDKEIKVVVLTGEGPKAFCAGSDISEMVGKGAWESTWFDDICHKAHNEILRMNKPVVAALNGIALGGGCTLACACDFRIAVETARMGLPELGLGIIPGAGGLDVVVKLIGAAKARSLVYSGELLNAQHALEIGMVDRVVTTEEFESQVREFSESLAKRTHASLALAKMAINRSSGLISESGIPYDTIGFALCSATEEKRMMMEEFLERKKNR